MSQNRARRISEEIKKIVAQTIREDIKDPRVSSLATVTKVETTSDLRYTTIYISVFGSDEQKSDTLEGLKRAKGFIRRVIGESLDIRYTPEPMFKLDTSLEYAINMSKLIDEVHEHDEQMKHRREELGLTIEDNDND